MTAAATSAIRRRAAAVIVISLFLPWIVDDGRTLRGIQVAEGQLVVITAVATIVMIRLRNRLSWFTAGFSAAVLWRQLLDGADGFRSLGPLLGALAATVAVVFLVWHMLAEIRETAER